MKQALLPSIACSHRPPCAGCPRLGADDMAPIAFGDLERVALAHGITAGAAIAGARRAFRMRARLAIRGRLSTPKLGLFESGSHRVVHIPNCQVQHPLINRVANTVRRALVESGVSSYSDAAHLGLARYLQVTVERSSQTAQVVLVANASTPQPLEPCLDLIRERVGAELHSLWFNGHCERANTVLGPLFVRWCGPEATREQFGGTGIYYPPGAFVQNNLDMAHTLIDHVRTLVPAGARVAEFYAGVGAIGLSLLADLEELRVNESAPYSIAGLQLGVQHLAPDEQAKVTQFLGDAAGLIDAAQDMSVVIADPPRKGLDSALIAALVARPPERFIYVSCNTHSLERDAALLTAQGSLKLATLTAFDLFPFTQHVESVACFEGA